MAVESVFVLVLISLSILLFSAKVFAEIIPRLKMPVISVID